MSPTRSSPGRSVTNYAAPADHGWSRAQLVARLPFGIGERTLLTYEHGTRQLTVLRFNEICRALGIAAPTLLGQALQRARIHLQNLMFQIDSVNCSTTSDKFRSMVQWAHSQREDLVAAIAGQYAELQVAGSTGASRPGRTRSACGPRRTCTTRSTGCRTHPVNGREVGLPGRPASDPHHDRHRLQRRRHAEPRGRGGRNPPRKVRIPKGRVVINGNPGRPAGQCHREQTAWCDPPGKDERFEDGPSEPAGRPLELPRRHAQMDDRPSVREHRGQDPAYMSERAALFD